MVLTFASGVVSPDFGTGVIEDCKELAVENFG